MRWIIAAVLIGLACGGEKEVEVAQSNEPTPEPTFGGFTTTETPAPAYPGFVIGAEKYEPPPEVGCEITITAMADGRFKVLYEGTGLFDYTIYYVRTLGEIRATPEAMDRAGYEGEPWEIRFQ